MSPDQSGRPILTLAELQAFDPQAPANRCWCPLCGKEKPRDGAHRSLSVDRTTGKWKCFRCGAGGTLREFWREKNPNFHSTTGLGTSGLGTSGQGAFEQGRGGEGPRPLRGLSESPFDRTPARPVATPAPIAPEVRHQLPSEPPASTQPPPPAWIEKWEATLPLENTPGAEYLLRRGIPLEVAQWAEVRYSPDWNAAPSAAAPNMAGEAANADAAVTQAVAGATTQPVNPATAQREAAKPHRPLAAVVFPIRERQGGTVAAQARAIWGSAKLTAGPKKDGAFFAPVQMKSGRVFGPLDRRTPVVTITEAPIDALSLAVAGFPAIALCGTSGPSWLHMACGLRRVALALDADEAGDRAATELTQLLSPYGATCTRLKPEGAKDWNEMLLRVGAAELADFLMPHLL